MSGTGVLVVLGSGFRSGRNRGAVNLGRLEAVEDEKKAATTDFKERIDLLKVQIKHAARTINAGVSRVADGKVAQGKGQATGAGVPGYVPEQDGEAAH